MENNQITIDEQKKIMENELQKGEKYLNDHKYKSAINSLKTAIEIAESLYHQSNLTKDKENLFLLFSLYASAHENLYNKEQEISSLKISIEYYASALHLIMKEDNYSQKIKNDITIISYKLAILNEKYPQKDIESLFYHNLKLIKKYCKEKKSNNNWLIYLKIYCYCGDMFNRIKKVKKAYRYYYKASLLFEKLYLDIYTSECEDNLKEIYQKLINICQTYKYRHRLIKFQDRLYHLNNYN